MSANPPKLGQLLPPDEHRRDAVHVAIAPVTAGERLSPGEPVGFVGPGLVGIIAVGKVVGVIDPFLDRDVDKGQRCWLLLFPDTVTSLRHHWTHPAFEFQAPLPTERDEMLKNIQANPHDMDARLVYADWLEERGECEEAERQRNWTPEKQASLEWLERYADECEISLDQLLKSAGQALADDEYYYMLKFETPDIVYDGRREFWEHFTAVTGVAVGADCRDRAFIRCGC